MLIRIGKFDITECWDGVFYPEVLKQAMETYHIESTKMMRYARRRGKEDELKKILEEIEDAEA